MREKSKGLPWSAVCNAGFVVIASFPFFPAWTPAFEIDAPLGKALYIAGLATFGILSIFAAKREGAKQDMLAGDVKDVLTTVNGLQGELKAIRADMVRLKGTENAPEVRAIDRVALATQEATVRLGEIFHLTGGTVRGIARVLPAHLTVTPAAVEQQLRNAAGTEELPAQEKPDA